MKTVEKRASELLKFFATISLILVTLGCIVFPMLEQILTQTNGITLAGVLACISFYILVIIMTNSTSKLPKSVQSPTKKLVMRALIFIIGLHSVFLFLVAIAYSIYLSKTSNTIQINTGVQILSATSLSIFLCIFSLSYFTVGKSTKVKNQIVIKDSFVKAYTGAVMVLISILVSCCVFQSVFVMKNKTGFFTWFGEIISVIFDGTSSFGDSFVIEPFGMNTLSNLYALMHSDSTPLYIVGALFLLLLFVPIKNTYKNISKELKESNDEIKGIIRNSEKPALLKRRLNHPMWGFCPNCGKRVRLILFAPYDRTKIVFDEDKIIDNAIELLAANMRKKGVPFNVEDYTATYVQYDTTVTDRTGNVLFTPYACSICCSTVYPDFAGKRENGHGVVFVKLIGGRNTGKSSLAVSLFNNYKDTLMIECTPEFKYYETMRLGLAEGIAPEATIPNVLSSPVLMMKSRQKYVSMMDVAGEHTQLVAASVQRRDTVAILIDIDSQKSIDDAVKALTFIPRKVRKIVIIITKIDKHTEYDEMKVHLDNAHLSAKLFDNVYNSSFLRRIRLFLKMKLDNEDKRTKRFLCRLESNNSFTALYRAACNHSSNVAVIANAGLGTSTNSNYELQGKYNPMYLDETVQAFLE